MEPIKLPEVGCIDTGIMGADIKTALKDKNIKTVLIKDSAELKLPAYLIDMTNVGEITEASLMALESLLREDGDTHIYSKNEDVVLYVGAGEGTMLYVLLENLLSKLFNDKCKIYYNSGDGFKITRKMDVHSVRLNL